MRGKWKTDLVTGLVTIICFLIYYSQTFSIRQTSLVKLTSTFIPRLCVAAGVVLGAVILLGALRERRSELALPPSGDDADATSGDRQKLVSALIFFVILFVSILAIKHLGFVWGSALYLMSSFLLCSRHIARNWPLYVALTVVAPVLIYMAFAWGFHLRLPAGFLGILGGIL